MSTGVEDDVASNNTLVHSISALEYGTLLDGGMNREYIYYHPGDAPENCPFGVLFATGIQEVLRELWIIRNSTHSPDEYGFAVCYPARNSGFVGQYFLECGIRLSK